MQIQVGFLGLLALIFITLKLIGVLAWSWTAVLSPIWLPWLIALILLAIASTIYFLLQMVQLFRNE